MATRRSVIAATPVTDSVAAILLHGWSADPPAGRAHGFGDGLIDLVLDLDPAECWREHEAYLRGVAARWKWEPTHYIAPMNEFNLRLVLEPDEDDHTDEEDGPFYFAEALALAGPQRV